MTQLQYRKWKTNGCVLRELLREDLAEKVLTQHTLRIAHHKTDGETDSHSRYPYVTSSQTVLDRYIIF